MKQQLFNKRQEQMCWTHFSRRGDAIFRSLGKEIRIGVLSVATLSAAAPASATAEMAITREVVATSDGDGIDDSDNGLSLDNVEVVGTLVPLPADKAVRLVQVISRKEIEASSAQSVNDLLKLAAGVDVRQRGCFGVQTDIGVNGGNHDQLTLMLNGVNISSPQTGHHTTELPVSIDDIERIEIIEGGASRVYGSSAFAGAINIVTKGFNGLKDFNDLKDLNDPKATTLLGGHVYGGSYGTAGANASFAAQNSKLKTQNYLSGSYTRSDGAAANSDFTKATAFWRGGYSSSGLDVKAQAGMSRMDYGANTFYGTGSATQYEEERRYTVAVQGESKGKVRIAPQVYWTRALDYYVWTRSNPAAYQNFHQVNVYGANVNASTSWALGKSAIGFEFRRENLLSTRLGKALPEGETHKVPGHDEHYKYKDGRSNVGLYLEHDILLRDVTISLGMLANKNTSVDGGMKVYPGIDVSWRVADCWKLYASFAQSLRVPTFTDLYYYGPGLEGHANLKPEKSTDYNAGVSYRNNWLSGQVKGFYRCGTDMIDWVKRKGATVYTSDNCDIDNIGAEALVSMALPHDCSLTVGYCYNHQQRKHVDEAAEYASPLSYLKHKAVVSLNHPIVSRLSAQWDFTYKSREGEFDDAITAMPHPYGSFCTLDAKVQWAAKAYTLYVQANNLTNRTYYDIPNVPQPGFWLMSGAKINLNL